MNREKSGTRHRAQGARNEEPKPKPANTPPFEKGGPGRISSWHSGANPPESPFLKGGLDCAFSHFASLGLAVIVSLFLTSISAHAMSGRQVYEKVHEVRSRMLDRKTEVTMVLFDRGGGKRTRTLTEYGKKADPEAYKVLVVFKSPPDLKDVGFLMYAHTFADRDLWAYFPEYKRVRRIPTTSQDDSFFGSDFTYDDFGGPPNLDDYKFSILGEENFDGRPCYVVEVTPKIRRKYTKYISWVAKDLWVQLKIDYYQDRDIYRQGVFRNVKVIEGIPTPLKLSVENRKTAHRTDLTIESIKYHTRFPDELFTQRALERGGR